MTVQRKSTRQRLVQAALHLFATQGVTETTTRQIADLAGVNEVTLFRHFGSKHGLLLAVMEEAEVFTQLGLALEQQAKQTQGFAAALRVYVDGHLQAIEQIPEFVRSLVGEAGHYPTENREAIGRGLAQIHHYTAQYLHTIMEREETPYSFTATKLASLVNTLLLGYAVMEFTTEFHHFWFDREEFIVDVVEWAFLTKGQGMRAAQLVPLLPEGSASFLVLDLPAPVVRLILQAARKSGPQDYAMVYVLFAAGLTPKEMTGLQRSHSICDSEHHILQIMQGAPRQVPLNQWIMGQRYGTYTKNPLTQWLRSRKDNSPHIFLAEDGRPMTEIEIHHRWATCVAGIIAPQGTPPTADQPQHTWRVEMLARGITPEKLSILCGCSIQELQPYIHRSQEKAALEEAIRLDQRLVKPE